MNLVFVYRPSTKKIIWYTIGRTSRQHDSTFQNGHIMVFDNNPYTSTGSSLVKFSENNPLNPIERINLKKNMAFMLNGEVILNIMMMIILY